MNMYVKLRTKLSKVLLSFINEEWSAVALVIWNEKRDN